MFRAVVGASPFYQEQTAEGELVIRLNFSVEYWRGQEIPNSAACSSETDARLSTGENGSTAERPMSTPPRTFPGQSPLNPSEPDPRDRGWQRCSRAAVSPSPGRLGNVYVPAADRPNLDAITLAAARGGKKEKGMVWAIKRAARALSVRWTPTPRFGLKSAFRYASALRRVQQARRGGEARKGRPRRFSRRL